VSLFVEHDHNIASRNAWFLIAFAHKLDLLAVFRSRIDVHLYHFGRFDDFLRIALLTTILSRNNFAFAVAITAHTLHLRHDARTELKNTTCVGGVAHAPVACESECPDRDTHHIS
jgi:hypothetical protein